MVKLASARESRTYGPRQARNRWEYINAGLHVFASVLLAGGFASQLPSSGSDAGSGLIVILAGLAVLVTVNGHDLLAHAAGIDHRFALVAYDVQLALVEFAVPLVHIVGTALNFAGVLLFFIQTQRGYSHRMEKQALNMLVAGSFLWVLGSIHNACQVYERADGHVQVLQKSVQIPFLMGSLLFFVGAVFNRHDILGDTHHTFKILGKKWVWLGIIGSLLFFLGGLLNVVKVFKMQQPDGVQLEKLRGGAQERLSRYREGQVPLILESDRRRSREAAAEAGLPPSVATPYKDVLLGSQAGTVL